MQHLLVLAQGYEPPWWAYLLFFLAMLAAALFARKRDATDFERLLRRSLVAHGFGLFAIAFGAGLAYIAAYAPLQDALAHRRHIIIHRGAVAWPALSVFMGALLLLAGKRWRRFVLAKNAQERTPLQWGMTALAVALPLSLEFGFEYFLRSHGYRVGW